jgi:hypothetical protein
VHFRIQAGRQGRESVEKFVADAGSLAQALGFRTFSSTSR